MHRADYSKENLIKIVAKSNTIAEVLIHLGIQPKGPNYVTLKKYLKKYNISIAHFKSIKHRTRNNSSKTEIICAFCGKTSLKHRGEINRQKRKGRNYFFCNNSCASKRPENIQRIKAITIPSVKGVNIKDEYSIVRYHLRMTKLRNKECDLDLEYLKKIWDSQNNKCAVTGITMKPKYLNHYNNTPFTASLDRINSNKGYIKGNVQFVCVAYNYAKHDFETDDINSFFNEMFKNWTERV